MPSAGQRQLLAEWNDTQRDYRLDVCLHEWFEAQVARTPDAIAVFFEGESLTYRELNRRANRLAHYLITLGVGPEVLVGIFIERSIEMVVGVYGILKAGGAYVPLDPAFPQERLEFMLEDTMVTVLLTQERLANRLPEHRAQVIRLDTDWPLITVASDENPVSRATADNLAYVIFTSGSTGRPKGAMNAHRAICNRLLWMQDEFVLNAADRVLQKTPFSFDVSVWELFWPLLNGARLVVARPEGHKDSTYLVELIAEHGITTLHFVPSMLQIFLQSPSLEACQCLRQVICGGDVLPRELQQRFFARLSAKLYNSYGPSEAAIGVTSWQCDPHSEHHMVPIGRPIANTQVHILDADLRPVAVGTPGELHIGGVQVGRGYLNRPELTAEKFINYPFNDDPNARLYKTGDLARYLYDGNIEFLGRNDHQVKIRGFRIELGEIESVLVEHSGIAEAVVIAREDRPGDKRLVAYLTAGQTPAPSIGQLHRFLNKKLPEYMIPAAFVFLDELPRTTNGKLDRQALPAPDQNRPVLGTTLLAPRDSVEAQLTKIWEKTLGRKPIGVRDNFIQLGGHSLLAVQLVHQIEVHFGIRLPGIAVFQAPTIERLAGVLQENDPTRNWASLVPLQANGTKPPFFFVAGRTHFGDQLGPDQPVYRVVYQDLEREQPLVRIEDMAAHSIKSVRMFQPQGPYYLGGHGIGGMVAFEMAHQLRNQGEQVALLALCECWTRDSRTSMPGTSAAYRIWLRAKFSFQRARRIGLAKELAIVFKGLKRTIQRAFWQRQSGSPTRSQQGHRAAAEEAQRNYVPQVISGGITVVRCTERVPWRLEDPLNGWGELATEGVEVHEIPGDHTSIYRRPNVELLASTLNQILRAAEISASTERMRSFDGDPPALTLHGIRGEYQSTGGAG